MPSITPVLAASATDPPGQWGMFFGGGFYYCVTFISNNFGTFLVLNQSPDGQTWTEIDSADRPSVANQIYTCLQVGTTLWVVATNGVSGYIQLWSVNMASPAWVTGFAGKFTPSGNPPASNLVAVAFQGGILVACPSDTVTISNVAHPISAYAIYDIAGDSWNAWTDLGYDNTLPISNWAVLPCAACTDASGRAVIALQQITAQGIGQPIVVNYSPGTYTYTVPADANQITVTVVGGGGAAGQTSTAAQGGGGGGGKSVLTFAVTPGATYTVVVGAGGATLGSGFPPGVAGGASDFGSGLIHATGGGANSGGDGSTGGAAGAGTIANGVAGQNGSGVDAGGNGGASGDGTPGGGAGGFEGAGTSGASGSGSGGVGRDYNSGTTPVTATGGDGYVSISYIPVRSSTVPGELLVQCVKTDGTLAALQILTQTFPIQVPSSAAISRPADLCCNSAGLLRLAISGLTTSGYDSIQILTATQADAPAFTLASTIPTGNSGSNSTPVLKSAIDPTTNNWYFAYWSASTPPNATLNILLNGSVLATATATIAGGGIQGVFANSRIRFLMGTPTPSQAQVNTTG